MRDQSISVPARANEQGSLFASITKKEIASAIEKQNGVLVPEDWIILEEPLKKTGEYQIVLKEGGRQMNIKINILPETRVV